MNTDHHGLVEDSATKAVCRYRLEAFQPASSLLRASRLCGAQVTAVTLRKAVQVRVLPAALLE